MTNTEKFFVECVKAGVRREKVLSIPSTLDYKQLYKLCCSHSLEVVFYYAIKEIEDKFPKDFSDAVKKRVNYNLSLDVKGNFDAENVLDTFERKGIKHLPLKGYWLKKLYQSSEMRYTHDVDVLVDFNDKEKFDKCVRELGLIKHLENDHHIMYYYEDSKTVFEFHKTVFEESLVDLFKDAFTEFDLMDGYKYRYYFPPEELYVSLLAHSAYHFSHDAGVGLRQVADIFVLKNKYRLDNEKIKPYLERFGLTKFEENFSKLCDYVFNNGKDDAFTEKLLDYVLESSVLGNKDKKLATDVVSADNKKVGKFKYITRLFFPTLKSMKHYYPILNKCVILLPVFYVVRWFTVLFTRPKNIGKIKKAVDFSDKELNDIKTLRENLGIENL